jgi:ribonuclease HI
MLLILQETRTCFYWGNFINHFGDMLGDFSSSLFAELVAAMREIKIEKHENWNFVWIECDSRLVVEAFSNVLLVSWRIHNPWANCLHFFSNMHFHISHNLGKQINLEES